MRPPVNARDLTYSSPRDGEELPEFSCDNENINRWFCSKSANAHQHFDCRVTYVRLSGVDNLAAFFSVCIRKEPQSDFAGKDFADRVFDDDRITTVHLKWLAVRVQLERRKIATVVMGRIVEDAYAIITKAGAHALTVQYMGVASERLYRGFGFSDYGREGQNKLFLPAQAVIDTVE